MNIQDLKCALFKKRFGDETTCFRYLKENNLDVDFVIKFNGIKGVSYQASGTHNELGEINNLQFEFFFQCSVPMIVNSVEEMFEFIEKSIQTKG